MRAAWHRLHMRQRRNEAACPSVRLRPSGAERTAMRRATNRGAQATSGHIYAEPAGRSPEMTTLIIPNGALVFAHAFRWVWNSISPPSGWLALSFGPLPLAQVQEP